MTETDEEFENRLCRVIAAADTRFFEDAYTWRDLGEGEAPSTEAIACVRDGDRWHQFVPQENGRAGAGDFHVVLFRFSETGPSAIGFVA